MSNHNSIERLMVRAPNWVGDAVMAVPAIRYLRRLFEPARITLVCRPAVAGLFESENFIDEVLITRRSSVANFLRDASRLRRFRFDLGVLLPNSAESALMARAAGAGRIAGYPTDGRGLLLSDRIPIPSDSATRHQVDYYLNLVMGVTRRFRDDAPCETDRIPRLAANESERDRARAVIRQHGIDPDSTSLLILSPGATNSRAKRWLPERFAEAADRLAGFGLQTIIVGTAGDLEASSKVASLMKSPSVVLAGKTGLPTLKGVLSLAALAISNDTGTAHVAAALSVPTVVVFGPTEHFFTRPMAELAEVVRRPVDCSPCMLRDCPIDHRCMTSVSVDQVHDAALRILPKGVVA